MLEQSEAYSGFAVPDVEEAKRFYTDILGIPVTDEEGMLALHIAGGRDILVYPKPDHAPANYTILNFPVSDVERAVDELTARGVEFQRYPGMEDDQDDKGVFHGGGPLIAWFTDPAGNIFSVIEGG
jgi:catechol 2,3-dioxygenase-like lactoylglutathione lyase family enzyme